MPAGIAQLQHVQLAHHRHAGPGGSSLRIGINAKTQRRGEVVNCALPTLGGARLSQRAAGRSDGLAARWGQTRPTSLPSFPSASLRLCAFALNPLKLKRVRRRVTRFYHRSHHRGTVGPLPALTLSAFIRAICGSISEIRLVAGSAKWKTLPTGQPAKTSQNHGAQNHDSVPHDSVRLRSAAGKEWVAGWKVSALIPSAVLVVARNWDAPKD